LEKKLSSALGEIVASFANPKPLRLMFQDEARFGRISDTRYCWARRPMRPLVKAMLTHQYTYAYGAVSPLDGKFDSLVLPHVNTECMQLFITEVAKRYPTENIVMVVDGAGWHRSKSFVLPESLRLHFLPPYSPELNPQEHIWDELREKYFHNQAFDSMDALEEQLLAGLRYLEQSPGIVKSISGWDWILNSVSNAN
jgi:transposase